MKKLYLGLTFVTLLCCSLRSYAQCDGIVLNSQAEVDAFPATYGCTNISGYLIIRGADITHLDSLYSVQTVNRLSIDSSPNIVSLLGLDNLTTLNSLEIYNLNAKTDLTGFDRLNVITGTATISNNPSLTNLQGLNNLAHVREGLQISGNRNLVSLSGLDFLSYVGRLSFNDNPALTDLSALSLIDGTNDVVVWNNDALTSLNGLHRIKRAWSVVIRLNDSLTDLDELAALDSIAWDLQIDGNPALTSIAGLSGMKKIHDLTMIGNTALTNIDGLNTIETVENLRFDNNPALTNLDGLSGLKQVRTIRLFVNASLEHVDGLSNVTGQVERLDAYQNVMLRNLNGLSGISGSMIQLQIWGNRRLENLDAFHNITEVGQAGLTVSNGIWISDNEVLQNLNGLSAVTKVNGPLGISNNAALTDLSGLSSLTEVLDGVYLNGNAGLLSLNGVSALEKIGGVLELNNNSQLATLEGLSSLHTIGGTVEIIGNPMIENFAGLSKLKTVGGGFEIRVNNKLTSFTGLDSLSSLGAAPDPSYHSLFIQENPALVSFNGLRSLKMLPGRIVVELNPALQNLDGLDSLERMEGPRSGVSIRWNNSLANINGLQSLETIYNGGIHIVDNPMLLNVDGLRSLKGIYSTQSQHFNISRNAMLDNIDGLSSLVSVDGANVVVILQDNPALTRCCGLYPLLHSGYLNDRATVTISGNGANCTREDIEAGGPCEGVVVIEQPTNLVFTNVTDTSMHVSFTPPANAPLGYVTLMRDNVAPYPEDRPWDGGTYFVGQKVGFATVVSYGATTEFDVTGLTPNTTYHFNVFSYGEEAPNGARPAYLVDNPLTDSVKTLSTPNAGVSFSNVTASAMTVSFATDPANPEGYIVLMRAYGSPSPEDVPADGTSYSVGSVIGSSSIVVGVGSMTSYMPMYLASMTRYFFDVYSYGAGYDYDLDNRRSGNEVTLSEDPTTPGDSTAQPTNIVFANVTENSMTVSFTAPSVVPDGYITLMRAFGSPSPGDVPVDGMSYGVGSVVGSSTIVVGTGAATSLDVVYLGSDIEYYFDVYSYTNTSSGPDYLAGPLMGHQRTSGAFARFAAPEEKSAPFPNPFDDIISIPFTTTETNAVVTITIQDQTGRKIAEVVSDSFLPGYHEVQWDRRDLQGNRVGNGLYVVNILSTGKGSNASGMVVAK